MRKKFLLAATLVVALIASVSQLAIASPPRQNPKILNIGVIGPFDGPTALGVTLAVQRVSSLGPLTTPDGTAYTLGVMTADASKPEEVTGAITRLKASGVVAIFGPDDDKLTQDTMPALQAAGIPIFTAATATNIKPGGLIFRTRANDTWRMTDLADIMLTDLARTHFAIFQGDANQSPAVGELVTALTKRGKAPEPPVIQVPNGKMADSATVLTKNGADTIIAFGDALQISDLYRTLKAANFNGTFVTPQADNRVFVNALPETLRGGIYGVTNWPYSWSVTDSANFLRDYFALFGTIPGPWSAASYDAAVATLIAVKNSGVTPDAIRDGLLKLPRSDSLQGFFNPALGNNELTASVSIIITNRYGAPTLLARYEETGRIKVTNVKPSPFPPATLTPSPTPEGVVGTMKGTVNVRNGPGANYLVIGQLRKGDQVPLIGASADFKWYVINFRQQNGWISADLVTVFGDARTLPVVAAPPTPIPSATPLASATPAPPALADIIMLSAAMNPPVPQPGQPFTLHVTIKNQGSADAGPFAVATSFKPGDKYTAANVPGLGAGQTTAVDLTNTVDGTGTYTVAIVLDLNKQVDEGPAGEANNSPTFTYKIDHPYIAQGTVNIAPGNSVDFHGGSPDVSYTTTQMAPVGAAKIGAMPGVQLSDVHYDFLSPDKVNTTPIPRSQLTPGMLIAMYTAEGRRGVLRVSGYSGDTIIVDFYVYGP